MSYSGEKDMLHVLEECERLLSQQFMEQKDSSETLENQHHKPNINIYLQEDSMDMSSSLTSTDSRFGGGASRSIRSVPSSPQNKVCYCQVIYNEKRKFTTNNVLKSCRCAI